MKKRTQINNSITKKIVMITELKNNKIMIIGIDYNNFEDIRITVDYSELKQVMNQLREQGFDVAVIEYFYKTRFGEL